MKILFLTLVNIPDFEEQQNIYADQCRELVTRGHIVHIVCPDETGYETCFVPYADGSGVLRVKSGQVQKVNIIRKGFAMLTLGSRFKEAINTHLKDTKYDVVMYSTPPITLVDIVKYIKKRDGAKAYLLLKDIFPQNAVDLGLMSKTGLKAPIYWYFRSVEKKLYAISDWIGCMSQANVDYIDRYEPLVSSQKLHISPNAFEPNVISFSVEQKKNLRKEYGLPENKRVFVYGGNIGKPQSVSFIIKCMKEAAKLDNCFFVICGTGTEYGMLEQYVQKEKPENLKLIPGLPREKYESFVGCCDVGLIFLDYRFTIPNFPSRLLSYMQKSMPVIACTDIISDVGQHAEAGHFGFWCPSNDPKKFVATVQRMCDADTEEMGRNAAAYLVEHYNVKKVVDEILDRFSGVI